MNLTPEDLIELHNNILQDWPARSGHDRKKLDICFKNSDAQTLFYAASQLAVNIVKIKPFNSLNKRMAILAIDALLFDYNFEFQINSSEAIEFTSKIENNENHQKAFYDAVEFISSKSKPL